MSVKGNRKDQEQQSVGAEPRERGAAGAAGSAKAGKTCPSQQKSKASQRYAERNAGKKAADFVIVMGKE